MNSCSTLRNLSWASFMASIALYLNSMYWSGRTSEPKPMALPGSSLNSGSYEGRKLSTASCSGMSTGSDVCDRMKASSMTMAGSMTLLLSHTL